ncbi:MAG: RIP metalloprotease RseP, partial [Elusimicrobia bacterium]|nr:RIP metalloprotease RseP [Elusimicrobiota bacterium]
MAILFTFSLVIFVHELGHFIVAVKSGVTVKKFSLGFGPELIGFTRKGVRYRISAIPMGGYVEMKGQSIEEEDALEEGSFMSLPPLKRIPILFAGAGMNFLMGIIIFFFIFLSAGVYIQTNIAQVGGLMEGFPAQAAGFEEGDRILSSGGVEVSTWDDLSQEISIRGGIETEFILEREGESFSIISVPKLDTELDRGFMGIIAPGEYVGMGVFRSLK